MRNVLLENKSMMLVGFVEVQILHALVAPMCHLNGHLVTFFQRIALVMELALVAQYANAALMPKACYQDKPAHGLE